MQFGVGKSGGGRYMDDDWDAEGVGPGFHRVCINLQHAVALQNTRNRQGGRGKMLDASTEMVHFLRGLPQSRSP